jgi:hypothetical protein
MKKQGRKDFFSVHFFYLSARFVVIFRNKKSVVAVLFPSGCVLS